MRKMDDTEDDARYPPKPYYPNNYSSSHRPKSPLYPQPTIYQYDDEEDQDEDDEFEDDNDEENQEEVDYRNGYRHVIEEEDDFERHSKKRKLKNLASGYEFAPRMVPGRVNLSNSGSDWSDNETFVLLEAWGERFLQLGRKSLRSEDWHEVAEKVSEALKSEKMDVQCRNRLDAVKKRYRKEKERVEEMGLNSSKWVFFKKMEMLMASSPRQESGLACGVDSGEYVFMNPRVYLDRSNGLDEMRDSPEESETEDDDDDSDGLPPRRSGGNGGEDGASFRLLANSIQKFGEIYEKIESSKRQQMMELERMRIDFNRELELQKKQILERAQDEIAKIREDDDDEEEEEEEDASAENLSG